MVFNNGTKDGNCIEDNPIWTDAVEINSKMPIKTDLQQTSDITEKFLLIAMSIFYAGICPAATVLVFIHFIIENFLERYTDCYCMQRPLQHN